MSAPQTCLVMLAMVSELENNVQLSSAVGLTNSPPFATWPCLRSRTESYLGTLPGEEVDTNVLNALVGLSIGLVLVHW